MQQKLDRVWPILIIIVGINSHNAKPVPSPCKCRQKEPASKNVKLHRNQQITKSNAFAAATVNVAMLAKVIILRKSLECMLYSLR